MAAFISMAAVFEFLFLNKLCLIYIICVCLRIVVSVSHMLQVSVDCQFVIAPSVFSKIY